MVIPVHYVAANYRVSSDESSVVKRTDTEEFALYATVILMGLSSRPGAFTHIP